MRTRRSYFPPTSTIPRRSRKQTTNVVEPKFCIIVEMADNRTMTQMLQAPIEEYEDAIVVPQINANNFELKQTLINIVQSNQFTGEAQIWLDNEPSRSILTWEDLVSKFINQFFPPSKTTYLRNEITIFLQKPNETFNEAWERFKDLLRQCPHLGFSELHQLDTFYNALNTNDQDALDSAAGGNFLDKIPRECLSIIESKSKSKVRYSRIRITDSRANTNAPLSSSLPSNSFDLRQIVASLEDKLDICMNRFKKSLNDMKNSFVTPTAPIKAVEEVTSKNGSKSIESVNDNSSVFTTISNLLFDNEKINSDEVNLHVEFNSDESTSNHDTVKFDYLDEFYGPFIPIHILEEERIRRKHANYINRMEMLFTINPRPHPLTYANTNVKSFSSLPIPIQDSNPHQEEIDVVSITNDVLPPSVENDDSNEEIDAIDVLRVDNVIQNSEHEYSESEDSDFDNLPVPLPPPEPPDEGFDFEKDFRKEISIVRNTIVKFECIDARMKFDVFNDENDDLFYFMLVIFAKEFSLLSAESEDTIFDPGEARILLDKEPPRSILTWEDLDALDSVAGGNFLDNIPLECLSIIESKSKIVASLEDKLDIRMNRFEKSLNDMKNSFVTPTSPLKAVEDVCVTCGANHSYNHCPLTQGGNDFPVFHDNIQQFQVAAVGNFIQNRILNISNQMRPPGFNQPNQQNNQSRYQGNNFNQNQNRQNNQGAVYQNRLQQALNYQAPAQ
nr:hypothetical protein [Tanacetum cinerariifolium]